MMPRAHCLTRASSLWSGRSYTHHQPTLDGFFQGYADKSAAHAQQGHPCGSWGRCARSERAVGSAPVRDDGRQQPGGTCMDRLEMAGRSKRDHAWRLGAAALLPDRSRAGVNSRPGYGADHSARSVRCRLGHFILYFCQNRVHGAEQRPARRSRLCRLSDLAARQRLGSRRNAVRLLRLGQHGSAVVGAHASSCHSTGGCGRSDAHHGFHASLRRMATDTSARPAPLATNYPDVRVLGSGFRASRVLDDRECARVRRCALWHLLRAAVGAPIDGKDRP